MTGSKHPLPRRVVIKGIGVVAGGPFWCAQADANDAFDAFSLPFINATGLCMSGRPLSDLNNFIGKADAKSASGDIDSLQGLGRLQEAAASFRQAIRLDPAFNEAHNNLGVVLAEQQKWEEAAAVPVAS